MNGLERLYKAIDWVDKSDDEVYKAYQKGLKDALKMFENSYAESLCENQIYWVICFEPITRIPYIKKLKLYKITKTYENLKFWFTDNLTNKWQYDKRYITIKESKNLSIRVFYSQRKAEEQLNKII